jgi:hypothetical protein
VLQGWDTWGKVWTGSKESCGFSKEKLLPFQKPNPSVVSFIPQERGKALSLSVQKPSYVQPSASTPTFESFKNGRMFGESPGH